MARLVERQHRKPERKAYEQAISRLLGQRGRLDAQARRQLLDLLEQLRSRVVAELATATPGSRLALERTRAAIDEAIRSFVNRWRIDLADLQGRGFDLGVAMAEQPVANLGVAVGVSALTDDLLTVAQGFSADLISELAADVRKRINLELVSVATGVKTPVDAVQAIGTSLKDPSVFRTVGARAQAIVTTEVGRIQSLATQARLTQMSQTLPELKKRWVHSGVGNPPRPEHVAAGQRYSPDEVVGPIDVDADFKIGKYSAAYPRDPRLPASETVHCRCAVTPFVDIEEPAMPQLAPIAAL